MNYCPQCGQPCGESHRFCAGCGASLNPAGAQLPAGGDRNIGYGPPAQSLGSLPGPFQSVAGIAQIQVRSASTRVASGSRRIQGIHSFGHVRPERIKFQGAMPGLNRSTGAIKSVDIVARIAAMCGASPQEAAAVVDGFWIYVTDPKNYTHEGTLLIIPHFGFFRRNKGGRNELIFKSKPVSQLKTVARVQSGVRASQANAHWISRFSAGAGNPHKLSVKRRITWYVSQATQLPVAKVDALMQAFFQTMLRIFTVERQPIEWAKRGVMAPVKEYKGRNPANHSVITRPMGRHYTFRAAPTLKNQIKAAFR